MIRRGFRMWVGEGQAEEYERRHNPIWPELERTLYAHGVHTYSIFLDAETNSLFGYVEIESEERWAAIATTEICKQWWRHMRAVMPSNSDDSPVSRECREVFHIDRASSPLARDAGGQ